MKVVRIQPLSNYCFICGINNDYGLKAKFYEVEDESVVSIFEYDPHHQSYPGRTHGGIITAMLDEVIGRAIWIYEKDTWGVTTSINVKFRKEVPYSTKLKAIGRITKNGSRLFSGIGKLYDSNGNLLATAEAMYYKLDFKKITGELSHEECNIIIEDDVKEI